ncbi:MAG: tRNA (guanosine(46)-N7)-methyltransferase TrmB [Gammaproteobacteria bacterium]
MISNPPLRRIRSFVRRVGRLTEGQQRALDQLWSVYGLKSDCCLDINSIFDRAAPLTLEIGFGSGTSLAAMAEAAPDINFLGIEVHRPGVGHLLYELQKRQLSNVRVWCHDAVEILACQIPDQSLDRVLLFFPDPWPKRKHHKRRLIQADFVTLLGHKLKPGGQLHLATDWDHYAKHMLKTLDSSPLFRNLAGASQYTSRPEYRPETRFEARGKRLGHTVRDLLFERI